MDQLTFSSGERPANHFPSPVSERDWMIRVVSWPSSFCALLAEYTRDGSFGKTSPAHCHPEGGWTLGTSSRPLLSAGMAWRGESWMLKISESPNAAAACLLSDILETGDLQPRFYLSPRACAGILNRATVRGRKLPTDLESALMKWSIEPPAP